MEILRLLPRTEVISVPNVSEESIPLRTLEVIGFHVLPSQVKKLRLVPNSTFLYSSKISNLYK